MNLSNDCLAALVRLYKVTCVTALSEMVGMDGTPNDNQLDASIEAGVRAVAEAVGKGLAPPAEAVYNCAHCGYPNPFGEDHADCESAAKLNAELTAERTVADDLRDYGSAFEVDGKWIDARRVTMIFKDGMRAAIAAPPIDAPDSKP